MGYAILVLLILIEGYALLKVHTAKAHWKSKYNDEKDAYGAAVEQLEIAKTKIRGLRNDKVKAGLTLDDINS